MIFEISVLLGAYFVYLGVFLGILWIRKWRLDRQKLRVPVAEKLLRGPGEGLQKKLEALEDQLSEQLALSFVLPLLCASVYFIGRHASPASSGGIGVGVVGGVTFAFICRKMFRLLDQRRNYRLGLLGERAVGEELNQLMLSGCRVFHDVPNDPYGNVDHVLIAPSGVYAVETKARHKKESAGRDAHKVIFDGSSLRFAGGAKESKCLDQARQQASRLSDWLSKAVGEAVHVQPVLALPGWWVQREGKGAVSVINGKEVYALCSGSVVLDAAQIGRIAHQLDQRCRDVEF
jgi:hypothetical protein